MPGVGFEINKEGEEEVLFSKTTDKNGEIYIEDILIGNYEIREVSAPFGYVINKGKEKFSINESNVNTYEMTLINKSVKGHLEIVKWDNERDKRLEGVEFTVYAAEEISNLDGVLYEEGEVVEILLTDKEGTIVSKDLVMGKYYVIETKELEGYKKNSEELEFEITNDEEVIKLEVKNCKEDIKCTMPKTGDYNKPYLYILLIILGICAAYVTYYSVQLLSGK